MKKLRIAMVATYPPEAALPEGAYKPRYVGRIHPATPVRTLSGPLHRREDLDVRVFVHSRAVSRVQEGAENGVPFTYVPKYEPGNLDPFHAHLPALLQMTPVLRRFRPDVVQGFGTEGANGLIAVVQRPPSVVFLQGLVEKLAPFSFQSKTRLWAGKRCERWVVRRAQGLIGETGFAAEWAKSTGARARIAVIPHAVEREWFACRPAFLKKNILSIGTLNRIKGMDTVLRAFAMGRDRVGDATLHIVGSGPLEPQLRRLALDLGVAGQVVFHGNRSRKELLKLMGDACVVVLGSRMDTAPNVVTEAHAAGLPVVATRAGGIPDMVEDGHDGYLVEVDNVEQMAERLAALASDPAACRRIGAAGREKVSEVNDPDRIAATYASFYRRLLQA